MYFQNFLLIHQSRYKIDGRIVSWLV